MNAILRASLVVIAPVYVAFAQAPIDASGHWEGTLKAPNGEVGISVDLARNEKQAWIGHFSFIGQGPQELPLESISAGGATVSFNVSGIPGGLKFEGKLDRETKAISGSVTAEGKSASFELKRTGEAKVVTPPPSTALAKEFEGKWDGVLQVGQTGQTYRVILRLNSGSDGRAAGTLTSVDQGAVEIPIGTIAQSGNNLEFEIKAIGGKYSGTMNEAKDQISGNWSQAGHTAPLVYKKAAAGK